MHNDQCFIRALQCAAENIRDNPELSLWDADIVSEAKSYYDGLLSCICDKRIAPDFIATITVRELYSPGYKVLQVEIREPGNLETVSQIHEMRAGYLPDHAIAHTVGLVTGLHGLETDRIYIVDLEVEGYYEVFIGDYGASARALGMDDLT